MLILATNSFAALDTVMNPESGNIDYIGQSASDIVENDARYLSTGGLFQLDVNDDLMPLAGSGTDTYFELDVNDDIMPIAA